MGPDDEDLDIPAGEFNVRDDGFYHLQTRLDRPSRPEAWLLGKTKGFPDALMPVVHSLHQARQELIALRDDISTDEYLVTPGGAASIGFHLAHIAGSLDRLFTYARGEQLAPDQLTYLHREADGAVDVPRVSAFTAALDRIDTCLNTLRGVPADSVYEPREVGRDRLPSNVIGLLFHAAEHTTMHVGQVRTTLKIMRGLESLPGAEHSRDPS